MRGIINVQTVHHNGAGTCASPIVFGFATSSTDELHSGTWTHPPSPCTMSSPPAQAIVAELHGLLEGFQDLAGSLTGTLETSEKRKFAKEFEKCMTMLGKIKVNPQ